MVGRCRSGSVSRILSTPEGAGWPFFSRPYGHAPQNGVQLLPGVIAGRRPFPCLSCIAWGLPGLLCYHRSGGLLPHLFTLTLAGGLFSVALSVDPVLRPGLPGFHRARCLVMSGLSSAQTRCTATIRTRTARPAYTNSLEMARLKPREDAKTALRLLTLRYDLLLCGFLFNLLQG